MKVALFDEATDDEFILNAILLMSSFTSVTERLRLSSAVQINDDILVRLARLVDVRRNSVLHLDLFEIY